MSIKKSFLFFIIFITGLTAFAQNAVFHMKAGVGMDFLGNHKTIIGAAEGNADVDLGFSVDFELGTKIDFLFFGIGFESQLYRKLSDYTGDFAFLPMFLYIELNPNFEMFSPYVFGKFGYNLLYYGDLNYTGTYGQLSGSIYWGVGAGVDLLRFQSWFGATAAVFVEISYSINYGSIDDDYFSIYADIEYSKLNLRFGTRSSL